MQGFVSLAELSAHVLLCTTRTLNRHNLHSQLLTTAAQMSSCPAVVGAPRGQLTDDCLRTMFAGCLCVASWGLLTCV